MYPLFDIMNTYAFTPNCKANHLISTQNVWCKVELVYLKGGRQFDNLFDGHVYARHSQKVGYSNGFGFCLLIHILYQNSLSYILKKG